jgi:hypothetical protein
MLDIPAEQNIGNGTVLQPQPGGATVIPQTNPERILMLSGPSSAGQTTSVALTASRIVGQANPNPGFPGPITGVIEFGNGSQFTRVEVDIPIGPFAGAFQAASPAIQPEDGGIIITVPTGVLRVYARYDNNLIQPMLQNTVGQPIQSLSQYYKRPFFIGPGCPAALGSGTVLPNQAAPPIVAEPVLVKAMAAYFSRHTSKVYKTQYLYVADKAVIVPGPSAIPTTKQLDASITLAANSQGNPVAYFCIPPFARTLKVFRQNDTSVVKVFLFDNNFNKLEVYTVASGPSPIIPLTGNETIVGLVITDPVWLLALGYEIGI